MQIDAPNDSNYDFELSEKEKKLFVTIKAAFKYEYSFKRVNLIPRTIRLLLDPKWLNDRSREIDIIIDQPQKPIELPYLDCDKLAINIITDINYELGDRIVAH